MATFALTLQEKLRTVLERQPIELKTHVLLMDKWLPKYNRQIFIDVPAGFCL